MTDEKSDEPKPKGKKKNNSTNKKKNNSTKEANKLPTGSDNWKTFLQTNGSKTAEDSDDEFNISTNEKENGGERRYKCIAIDCEMVGIGADKKGNMLGRISIVNTRGECLYDTYVKPTATVTDYRTHVSGLTPENTRNGEKFQVVQAKVSKILSGRILVGHAVYNDLAVLKLSHPRRDIRDTSGYKKFRELTGGTPSLKKLTSHYLNVEIQENEHCSIQDAQAAMQLYIMHRKEWEGDIRKYRHAHHTKNKKKSIKSTHRPLRMHKNYSKMK